ncbi:scamp-domain-containing protein [Coprinopsis marcescibilis]|uniref:Scamp-domain-containing protein n=1 Tax=Coprinopsis marcescibilis TaxID=230819 RepID=A0A5C3LBH4_COPMA|nr:scamp-domain-containing protein [Coprinopsis marcescibilis]
MSGYNQNPFASSHSLDTNPFDDPAPAQQSIPSATDAARLEEIRRREQDLERREAELTNKADHIRRHGRNNFPFFFPLIFHSIQDEIPEVSRPLITRLYQLWLVLIGTLVLNMVTCIVLMVEAAEGGGGGLGASIMYLFVITIGSFLSWYRPIYNGYMKNQSLYFYLYFLFGGLHLLFSVYMIIGIPGSGSAGLIQTIRRWTKPALVSAILGTITTVGWVLQGAGNAYFYLQIWREHNTAGHSFDKAKQELAQHGAKAYFSRG